MTDYQITRLDGPDGESLVPLSINNRGMVVGQYQDDLQRGVIYDTHTGVITVIDPASQLNITPIDINDDGQVVGYDKTANYKMQEGFAYDSTTGALTQLNITGSTLPAINDAGLAIGSYLDRDDVNQGFVDDTRTGTITELDIPGGTAAVPVALNQAGDVIGEYNDASGQFDGFLRHPDGTFDTIDVPGASNTAVEAINDKGQVAGTFDEGNADHLYVEDLATQTIQTFGVPDAVFVQVREINDDGLVLGDYQTDTSGDQGFIYDSKTDVVSFFSVPGASWTHPDQLNDQGQIVGTFENGSGEHGFVATPTSEPPCYCPGTLIETDMGERPVEQLAIGDMLLTASGRYRPVKWVGHTKCEAQPAGRNLDGLPVCIKAGALGAGLPRRDLWVSPGHAMLVDGALVHARLLINGASIVQPGKTVMGYFHVELDNHDIVVAEGVMAESFLDNGCRRLFSNAADFWQRYPDFTPGPPCMPLLEDGFALQAIRHRIDERAGLATTGSRELGPLRGFVDAVASTSVRGWAQDRNWPEEAVYLDVLIDGAHTQRVVANHRRGDLVKAGVGSGRHSFEAQLPAPIKARVEVRRSRDHALLPLTAAARLQAARLTGETWSRA